MPIDKESELRFKKNLISHGQIPRQNAHLPALHPQPKRGRLDVCEHRLRQPKQQGRDSAMQSELVIIQRDSSEEVHKHAVAAENQYQITGTSHHNLRRGDLVYG